MSVRSRLDVRRHIQRASALVVGALVLGASVSPAVAFDVTGSLTGWWNQPDEQNHGLIINISQLPSGEQTGVAFWAHYDDQGNPTWLLAQGSINGDTVNADLYQVRGIEFMQASGAVSGTEEKIGTLDIVFEDCNNGEVSFTADLPSVGSGQFRISRLTTIPGVDCSGGITDNIPPSAAPHGFKIDLQPASAFPAARGDADLNLRPGSGEFEVEIENVPAGTYTLFVGGVARGQIVATLDGDDLAEGDVEFRSPQRREYPLLDFDPRGQDVEVFSGQQLVLSARAPEPGAPSANVGAPGFGDDQIIAKMTNAGVYPGGEAEAELEREQRLVSFEIDVDDIPVGEYSVRVDTVTRGTLSVTTDGDGDTDGELEFRYPATPGFPLLDFDPRGSLIELTEGETTLFFIERFEQTPKVEQDLDGIVAANEPAGEREDGTGAFRTHCLETHIAFDDPLVHPRRPGAAHEHVFLGNPSVDAFTTQETLLEATETRCDGGTINRSGYWMPSLYDAHGDRIKYVDPLIYYKTGYHLPPESIVPPPAGLQMIAGNAMASAPQNIEITKFRCYSWTPEEPQFSSGDPLDHVSTMPDCAEGDILEIRLVFPQCWDGVNLTSDNLQSHMAYPSPATAPVPGTGSCPASHPVAIPEISYNVGIYITEETGPSSDWRFVTDPAGASGGTTLHGDWMNGWNEDVMQTIVERCLNGALECMVGLLGDGTMLRPILLD